MFSCSLGRRGPSLTLSELWVHRTLRFKSLMVHRFWADRCTPPTTSWEVSRSCTTMASHTPPCRTTLRASSPSSSGSPTCQRFGGMLDVGMLLTSLSPTDHRGCRVLIEQTLAGACSDDNRPSRQGDRVHPLKGAVRPSLDAGWETPPR